jgi:hypothetical protein
MHHKMIRLDERSSVRMSNLPNFLFNEREGFCVSKYSERELRKIGREWTKELVAHAKRKREKKS